MLELNKILEQQEHTLREMCLPKNSAEISRTSQQLFSDLGNQLFMFRFHNSHNWDAIQSQDSGPIFEFLSYQEKLKLNFIKQNDHTQLSPEQKKYITALLAIEAEYYYSRLGDKAEYVINTQQKFEHFNDVFLNLHDVFKFDEPYEPFLLCDHNITDNFGSTKAWWNNSHFLQTNLIEQSVKECVIRNAGKQMRFELLNDYNSLNPDWHYRLSGFNHVLKQSIINSTTNMNFVARSWSDGLLLTESNGFVSTYTSAEILHMNRDLPGFFEWLKDKKNLPLQSLDFLISEKFAKWEEIPIEAFVAGAGLDFSLNATASFERQAKHNGSLPFLNKIQSFAEKENLTSTVNIEIKKQKLEAL